MSKKDYRKFLREKEVHKIELKKRSLQQTQRVYDIDVEERNEKAIKAKFFQDLRNACQTEYASTRYDCFIEVPHIYSEWELDYYARKQLAKPTPRMDNIMHPTISHIDSICKNLNNFERMALAKLFPAAKKSRFFEKSLDWSLFGKHDTAFLDDQSYLDVLARLAKKEHYWLRDPKDWVAPDMHPKYQMQNLIKYLLTKYEVPSFFYKTWFEGDTKNAEKHREWFINIGNGENLRVQKGLPIPVTKKAAHLAMTAPERVEIERSIIWGQIANLGGNEIVAFEILELPDEFFEHNDFWQTVFKFFIDNPMLDKRHYRTIYDFIFHQKFRNDAPQPNFSMKGREPNTLMLLVERWHDELERVGGLAHYRQADQHWYPCGIKGYTTKDFSLETGEEVTYVIKELTVSSELWREGSALHHCVGSYANSCIQKRCAIFSLREIGDKEKPLVTLEIKLPDATILQARGLCNKHPDGKYMEIINKWAKKEGVKKLANHW